MVWGSGSRRRRSSSRGISRGCISMVVIGSRIISIDNTISSANIGRASTSVLDIMATTTMSSSSGGVEVIIITGSSSSSSTISDISIASILICMLLVFL